MTGLLSPDAATGLETDGAEGPGDAVDAALGIEPGRHPPERARPAPERDPAARAQGAERAGTLSRPACRSLGAGREDHHGQAKGGGAGDREPRAGGRPRDKGHHPGRTGNQGAGPGEQGRDELPAGSAGRSRTDNHTAPQAHEPEERGTAGRGSGTEAPGQEDDRARAGRPAG